MSAVMLATSAALIASSNISSGPEVTTFGLICMTVSMVALVATAIIGVVVVSDKLPWKAEVHLMEWWMPGFLIVGVLAIFVGFGHDMWVASQ